MIFGVVACIRVQGGVHHEMCIRDRLQTLVCKASGESWTEDDRLNFSSFYTVFRQQFIALGGHCLLYTSRCV